MANGNTGIDWTEQTWNPVTGCTRVSEGCDLCYAAILAEKLHRWGNPRYKNGFEINLHEDLLTAPIKWKKPRVIFVNSMSDAMHGKIPDAFLIEMFRTMNAAHWHTFQILTKRPARLSRLPIEIKWSPNIWMGVTVESERWMTRIDELRQCPAHVKFISAEPLLSDLPNVDLHGIDWVICGGESQRGCRPMDLAWARNLRDTCCAQKASFFLKQLGGYPNKRHNEQAILDGRLWRQMPTQDSMAAIQRKDMLSFL